MLPSKRRPTRLPLRASVKEAIDHARSQSRVGEHLTDTALTSRVVDRFLDELEADSARVEEKR